MLPYIVCFAASIALFFLSDKVKKNQRIILDVVAIMILCLLAGLRSSDIGADTKGYLIPMIEGARKATDYGTYLNYQWTQAHMVRTVVEIEPAFSLLVYVITKITDSVFWVQFFIALLVIAPVYAVLKQKDNIATWFGMLVFLCLLFNTSLNAMRQAIAVSFSFLAIYFLQLRNWTKYIIYLATAVLFHKSAVLGLAIGAIELFLTNDNKSLLKFAHLRMSKGQTRFVFVLCMCLLLIPLTSVLIEIMKLAGLGAYTAYISGKVTFLPNQVIKNLPNILLFVMGYRNMQRSYSKTKFYLIMLVLVVVVSQYASVFVHSIRIADYFLVFSVCSIPALCDAQKQRQLYITIFIAYLVFYWCFCFGYQGLHGTVPYQIM